MAVRYLRNNEIDRSAWDKCIKFAENKRVYALSWYLDAVTCRTWDAVVMDDYRAVMPLPWIRKAGLKMYVQPWFCQQLGPFWTKSYPSNLIHEMIKKIPGYFYSISLNSRTRFFPENSSLELKPNKVLSLKPSYDKIYTGIKTNHKRNIKKALKADLKVAEISIDEYLELKMNSGANIPTKKKDLLHNVLKSLESKQLLVPRAAWQNGEALAAVCWIKDFKRLIYFQAAGNENGRKQGAAFLLVDEVLKEYSNTNIKIDFEGATDPGVRRFYRGFGATNEAYPILESKAMKVARKVMKK